MKLRWRCCDIFLIPNCKSGSREVSGLMYRRFILRNRMTRWIINVVVFSHGYKIIMNKESVGFINSGRAMLNPLGRPYCSQIPQK
jgi:hypothetical protein